MSALAVRFLPHSVNLGGATVWINGVESAGPQGGVSLFEESAGSETDREYVAIRSAEPTIPISTSDLSILTTVGMSGLALASASGAVVYGRELPFGALPTAIGTAHHVSYTVTDGLLVPVHLSASHNQLARLELVIHPTLGSGIWSGATPIVRASTVAITAGAGAMTNAYTTGPLKFPVHGGASSFVTGIYDIRVDFGLHVLKESSSGNVYPEHVSIIARMARIEFATKDVTMGSVIGDGVSVSSAAAYFQQISPNGQRVLPATATHVSAIGTAGMITPGATSLKHKSAGTVSFTYTPAKNTNLIVLSATSSIPTS
jgi:hypothetical protein